MANVSDTRKTRSVGNNTDLAPITKDPDRILRSAVYSFYAAFAKPDVRRDDEN